MSVAGEKIYIVTDSGNAPTRYRDAVKNCVRDGDADALDELRKCQGEIVSFRHRCDREIDRLEENYMESVKPFMEKRKGLIRLIPFFWSRAIINHPLLSTIFEPGESDVLGYLSELELEVDQKNTDHFKIHFSFRKNPFFEDRTLTKEFTEEGSMNSAVRWKKGQKFPKVVKHELWENDDLGLEHKGFFRWFLDPGEHYCDPIADIIKTCIWYNPMEFYDGKLMASDYKRESPAEKSDAGGTARKRATKEKSPKKVKKTLSKTPELKL